jgi:hypothetical protein
LEENQQTHLIIKTLQATNAEPASIMGSLLTLLLWREYAEEGVFGCQWELAHVFVTEAAYPKRAGFPAA